MFGHKPRPRLVRSHRRRRSVSLGHILLAVVIIILALCGVGILLAN